MSFLSDHGACSSTSSSGSSKICALIDACDEAQDNPDDDIPYDDDPNECSASVCNVDHMEWLGDGWCDDDSPGCYNTEVSIFGLKCSTPPVHTGDWILAPVLHRS